LIPTIALREGDLAEFEEEPLRYFARDVQGVENTGSRRAIAYSFLRQLGRTFGDQLNAVFQEQSGQLISSYQADPAAHWREMDTAIFVMGALAGQTVMPNQEVRKVVESFDLNGFVGGFILPQLQLENVFFILQADALKFIADFRRFIEPDVLYQIIPYGVTLLGSPSATVQLYAMYCIERICDLRVYEALLPVLLSIDLRALADRLFRLFTIGSEFNPMAPRCLLRLIATGQNAIRPLVPAIIAPALHYLGSLQGSNSDADVVHLLFELVPAAITQAHVPVSEIEEPALTLVNDVLTKNSDDFVPYAIQLFAALLAGYPEGVQLSDVYHTQFELFLDTNLWQAAGNVPALAILITAYCMRLPALVVEAFRQIGAICEVLLRGGRSHPSAFAIFFAMIRFIPIELVMPCLGDIFALVAAQVGAEGDPVTRYDTAFSVFMSSAATVIGPGNLISSVPADVLPRAVVAWGRGLKYVGGRTEMENALVGGLRVLAESGLSGDLWLCLFIGVVTLIEKGGDVFHERLELDIRAIREEEEDAKQFDSSFSKLVYGELANPALHPELAGVSLIEYFANGLAQISHARPGIVSAAIAQLPPHLQSALSRYPARFNISFV
jgi:exportin-2 (importin alpha re-exporter)